jgi:hypothetical protein
LTGLLRSAKAEVWATFEAPQKERHGAWRSAQKIVRRGQVYRYELLSLAAGRQQPSTGPPFLFGPADIGFDMPTLRGPGCLLKNSIEQMPDVDR